MAIVMRLKTDGFTKEWLVYNNSGALVLVTTSEYLATEWNKWNMNYECTYIPSAL